MQKRSLFVILLVSVLLGSFILVHVADIPSGETTSHNPLFNHNLVPTKHNL